MIRVLQYGIFLGLFSILFIPFIVSGNSFFPFITGKAFTFRIVVEIIFALWIILALRDTSVRPKGSTLLYALLALVASMGISTLLAENPHKSFWSNFERMEGYISILHFGAYFLVASSMLQTQKLWRAFWNTSIGVSVLLGLYGVFQLAGVFEINQGGVRVDATFGNASYLAVYMLFHFFITLLALVEWKPARASGSHAGGPKRYMQIFYGVALVLQALMVFYTATRGSILGLIGGLFLSGIIFIIFAKGQKVLRQAGIALAAIILVVSGGFIAIKDSDLVQNNPVLVRIASISLEEGETRFAIWGMAWQGFLERPVFGWGQENFNYIFNEYYSPTLYAQEPWFDRAHNIFFDWLVAGGIIGFLLYLSLFVTTLWYLWKPGSSFSLGERSIITGLLAGYSFHNLFVFDNLMSYVLFLSLLAYITVRNRNENTETQHPGKNIEGTRVWVATGGVTVLALLVLYMANAPGIVRATGIIDAIRPYEEGVTRNFEEFKEIVGPRGLGRQEVHEQLVQFAAQIRSQNLAQFSTDEFKTEVAQYALDEFKKEIDRTPNDARLRVFYGSYLRQLGLYELATLNIEKALELSPKKQSILFERALIESDQGNLVGALDYFKQAFELEPEYDQARTFYAATAIRTGNIDVSDQLLTERYGTPIINDPFILQAHLDTGNATRVLSIAEKIVEENPTNAESWTQLAAVYLGVDRRQDAITALEEAIRLEPSFKQQGEFFISEIRAGRNP